MFTLKKAYACAVEEKEAVQTEENKGNLRRKANVQWVCNNTRRNLELP